MRLKRENNILYRKLQKEERGLSGHKTIVYSNVIIEDFKFI